MGEDDRTFRANFSSDGVSMLREVVKEKLKEFMGDYTDDTLVEYVIVLLKNGRSKDEAKNELDVFLGDDSDPFISWLWDHLGSNIGLYVQPQELHPKGVPKTESAPGDQAGKIGTHQIEPETDKGNFIKTDHHNREYKGLTRVGDGEAPLPGNSVANNENSNVENQPKDSHAKPIRTIQSTIHKKRRRSDEVQRPRQREVLTVSAPKRLLQFAVRDAVGTSKPSNPTTEPSLKRLRSVVSTTTDSHTEERPQRVHRASMSVAIKAMEEAVKDVTKARPSRNVFDRLGNVADDSNIISHREYGGAAEDPADGDFDVEMGNFHSSYHPRNDASRLQEGNMPSFHDDAMDSGLGYDREGYDDVCLRGQESIDIFPSGTSSGNWVERSQDFHYSAADHVDGIPHRPRKDVVQPVVMRSVILRNSLSVSMNTRKPHYQEERGTAEVDNHEMMRGVDTIPTKSEARLMKENNNPTTAFNGYAKPDTLHESEKTLAPSGLRNTGPPTEDADSRTIFVSNVHFASTKDSLSQHFNKFGEVLKVIILTDPATGQPKGSAYIEFMRKEAADLALSLDGTSFMSRILKIVKKSAAPPDAASVMTWPRAARATPFVAPRYGRAPFGRGGIPSLYRGRVPVKPGARSFQWKRGADSTATETSAQASTSMISSPSTRSLTYVRAEPKTNGTS